MIWEKIKSAVRWVGGMISSAIRWLAKKCCLGNEDESASTQEAKAASSNSHITAELKAAAPPLNNKPAEGYKTEDRPIKNIATLCDYSIKRLSDPNLQNELKEGEKRELNSWLSNLREVKKDKTVGRFEWWLEKVKRIFAFDPLIGDDGNLLNKALFAISSSWEQNKYKIQRETNLAVAVEISNVMDEYAQAADFKCESSQALKRLSAVPDVYGCIQDFFTSITKEDYENHMQERFSLPRELPSYLYLALPPGRAYESCVILKRNLMALACSNSVEDRLYLRYALRQELSQQDHKYFPYRSPVVRKELLIDVVLKAVSANNIESCEMILKFIYKDDIAAMKDAYSAAFSQAITDNNLTVFKWILGHKGAEFLYHEPCFLNSSTQVSPEKYIQIKTGLHYFQPPNPFLDFFNHNKPIQQSYASQCSAPSIKLSS